MATDSGNAVVAEWVGPAGMQLFDGTLLNPGVIVRGIGKDEAENSDYWKPLGDMDTWTGEEPAGDAESNRTDWSFGTEEGGAGTGRPLTEDQVAEQSKSTKSSRAKSSTSSDTPASADVASADPAADEGATS